MKIRTGKIIQTKQARKMRFVLGLGLTAMFAVLLTSATGCVPIRHSGKTYYLILGAGIVRVSQTNEITVVKATSVGLYAGDGRINIGVSDVYAARVPTNANAILEITK